MQTRNEWQAECDRLGKIADAAWKRYGDELNMGGIDRGLYKVAQDAADAYDRHGEQEPSEPTITLTQSQVVALWSHKRWQRPVVTNDEQGREIMLLNALMFLRLLGAPEDWSAKLVESVVGG